MTTKSITVRRFGGTNSQVRCLLAGLLVFSVFLRLGLIGLHYSPELTTFQDGDYNLYHIGANAIASSGEFTNSLFLVRPPLYPLMINMLGDNTLIVLVANALIGSLLPILTYILGGQLNFSPAQALLGGLLVTIDPASVFYSAYLQAEPLANMLLCLALIALLHGINRRSLLWGILAGLLLTLSALARPATFLLWVVLAIWLFVAYRKERVVWRTLAAFATTCLIGIASWTIHNGLVFGNYNFSTIGVYNLLYYRAAEVEHVATGNNIDDIYAELSREVEQRLGHDTTQVSSQTRYGHEAATAPVQTAMIAVAINVFLSHPLVYILTVPLGFYRMYGQAVLAHNVLSILEIAWNLLLVTGTVVGLIIAFHRKRWIFFWLASLVGTYYTVGTLAVQVSALDARMRTMWTPLMSLAAVLAAMELVTRLKNRSPYIERR